MGIPVWKKCCCCSIAIACIWIGILGVIYSIIKLYNAIHFQDSFGIGYQSDHINQYVGLTLGAFGLAAFCCLIFSPYKKSEKMLIPALVLIPIDFLHGIIYMIVLAIDGLIFTGGIIVGTLLAIFTYIPIWIAIYSLKQELQGATEGDQELSHKRGEK